MNDEFVKAQFIISGFGMKKTIDIVILMIITHKNFSVFS